MRADHLDEPVAYTDRRDEIGGIARAVEVFRRRLIDKRVAEEALAAIPHYWTKMSPQRSGFSSTVLGGPIGGIVLARDAEEAIAFANDYAPEHLEVLAKEPFQYLGRLDHAGEILLGEHTPTTLGNFVLGPNHVLPTSGWARTASPVSVFDFMKRTSIAYVTKKAYPEMARYAKALATYEGFDGHANAVSQLRDEILKPDSGAGS
jgi:histidinol dehydrogenase